jgi:solute carrier family 35 protein E1
MGFLGSATVVVVFEVEQFPLAQIRQSWLLVVFASTCQALSTSCQNLSVMRTSISINQTVKSMSPILNMALSYLWLGIPSTITKLWASCLLLLGVGLSLFQNAEFDAMGFFYALLSLFFSSCSNVASSRALNDIPLHSFQLCASLVSFGINALLFFQAEYYRFQHISAPVERFGIHETFAIAVISYAYVISTNYIIFWTSATYYAVLGTVKVVLLIILSTLFFATSLSFVNTIGVTVAMIGFLLFSYASWFDFAATSRSASADSTTTPNAPPGSPSKTRSDDAA